MSAKITGYTVINLCQSIAVHTFRKRYVYILQWNPALWPPLTNSHLRYCGHFVIIWTLVHRFRKKCVPHSVDWKAGHYVSIFIHRANLSQWKGPKIRPRSAHEPKRTLPHPPVVCQNPLKYRHTVVVPMVSALGGSTVALKPVSNQFTNWFRTAVLTQTNGFGKAKQ